MSEDKRQRELYPPELYDGRPPAEEVDTSRGAADDIEPHANTLRWLVLQKIREQGEHGATDDELESMLELRHQTCSARRRELVLLGRVKHGGAYRLTSSGRKARVWVAV